MSRTDGHPAENDAGEYDRGYVVGYHDASQDCGADHYTTATLAERLKALADLIRREDCGSTHETATSLHAKCGDAGRWPAAECRACTATAKAFHMGVEHLRSDALRIVMDECARITPPVEEDGASCM